MADTFGTPEASPEISSSKNSSKTVIILIVLIIFASIGLGITIAVQNKNNSANPPEKANKVAPAKSDTTNTTTAPTTPVDKETLAKRRAERVPDFTITKKQFEDTSKRGGCWTIINGAVYDTSDFIRRGQSLGIKAEDICGKDGTKILTEERNGQPPIEESGQFSPYARPVGKIEQ